MKHSSEPWFLGKEQVDPGEWEWDGKVYSTPSEQDLLDEAAANPSGNPFFAGTYEVAKFHDEADARRARLCVNACAGVADDILAGIPDMKGGKRKVFVALFSRMHEALKLARDRGRFSRMADASSPGAPQFDDPLGKIEEVLAEVDAAFSTRSEVAKLVQ